MKHYNEIDNVCVNLWYTFTWNVIHTVRLVIFMGLIFRGLRSSYDFVDLYFCGISLLIT